MNATTKLLDEMTKHGARIVVGPDGVRLRAPKPLPADLIEELRRRKLEVVAAMHGLTLDELREIAGKDWQEIESNPALLECFAEMVAIRKMRERGEVPLHYTAVTVCHHCGPVPIFPGVAEKVESCPWCFNRAAGRPVPHSTQQRIDG